MISTKEYLIKEAKKINEALSVIRFEDRNIEDMFRYANSTGRRLRGVIVLTCCKAVGGEPEKAIPAAIAVELIHKSSLVHDDIIDESDVRRNRKTFHKVYGVEKGVVAGDLLCARAFEALDSLDFDEGTVSECYAILADALSAIYEGQYMDLALEGALDCDEYLFLKMLELKSGRLIEASAKLGGILGGGSQEEVKALASYAKNLATAFQVQNDINNIIGTEKKLGIKKATDLYRRKCSLPIIHSLKSQNRDKVVAILSGELMMPKDISGLVSLLQGDGSMEYAQNYVKNRLEMARKSLRKLRDSEFKELMSNLAVFETHKWYW
jgi:geranylgeranyl diphosphate synthase, type I